MSLGLHSAKAIPGTWASGILQSSLVLDIQAQQKFSQRPRIGFVQIFLYRKPKSALPTVARQNHVSQFRGRNQHRSSEKGAADFNEVFNRLWIFCVTAQNTVNSTGQDLSKVPPVDPDDISTNAIHRHLNNHSWSPMATIGWATIHQTLHKFLQSSLIENTVFHSDIDVVGGRAIFLRLDSSDLRPYGRRHNRWVVRLF